MKPHLKIVAGRPVVVRNDSPAVAAAREKFGRSFAHEWDANWLEHPERVLNRWARRADYFNLNPHKPRPPKATCHFKAAR